MGTNWWISFARTLVAPLLVGLLMQLLVGFAAGGIGLMLRSTIVVVVAALYYLVARMLQQRWPMSGFLLVVAAEPYYDDRDTDRLLISIQRTVIPLAVGWIVVQLADWLFEFSQPVGLASQVAATTAFYGALRYVEERSAISARRREVAGILLGSAAAPHY